MNGKGQNPTDDAYFKVNPRKLKEKYVEFMDCLYVDFDIKEVKSEEVIRLENENKLLKQQNEETIKRIDNLEKLVLGDIPDDRLAKLHKIL